MAKIKKRLKLGNIIFTIICLGISGYLLFTVGQDILMTLKLSTLVKDSQKQIEQLEIENQKLVNQKIKLNDPEYVKSYARGAYMLSKTGEQIFHLNDDE